jgi:hypothetical protein
VAFVSAIVAVLALAGAFAVTPFLELGDPWGLLLAFVVIFVIAAVVGLVAVAVWLVGRGGRLLALGRQDRQRRV